MDAVSLSVAAVVINPMAVYMNILSKIDILSGGHSPLIILSKNSWGMLG